jgi:CHASE2 domain-containing sensor protein
MYDPALNLLALSYRTIYTVLGGYLTARYAPHSRMAHVWVYGTIGLVLGTAGAIVTIPLNLGPAWYPVAIALTALPCAWLGGVLYRMKDG